jgi:hypothetical protein
VHRYSSLNEVNRLADHPRWYNALTQNRTTNIREHTQKVDAGDAIDWRLLANGHVDQLLYERRQIDTDLPSQVFEHKATSPKGQKRQTSPLIFAHVFAWDCQISTTRECCLTATSLQLRKNERVSVFAPSKSS